MPDWLSHIIIGLIAAELFNIDKKGLVVLGSLLPDFIAKIYMLSFFYHLSDSLLFISTLYHSPIMGILLPALIAPLFKYDWKKTYLCIILGFMLHIMADSFTFSYGKGGILLYPMAHGYFSFNVFWPEQYWLVLIASAIAYALVRLAKNKISAKKLFNKKIS